MRTILPRRTDCCTRTQLARLPRTLEVVELKRTVGVALEDGHAKRRLRLQLVHMTTTELERIEMLLVPQMIPRAALVLPYHPRRPRFQWSPWS